MSQKHPAGKIPNYFIHYWVSRLGPKLSWLVIALQQACWRADDDQCAIAQTILADEIGVERHTISRILNDYPLRAWYIPEIGDQPGEIKRADGPYQPLPRRYTVYLSTPPIPEHLAGLDSDTLALFRQALSDLQVNGSLVPKIKTPIPPDLLNFFIRFAEAFAGLEATAVRAALSREDVSAADPALEPASGELDRLWFQALEQLQTQMTRQTFDTWLRDTQLIASRGRKKQLCC